MPNISETWGTEPQERVLNFPCDRVIANPDAALYRGVTIKATPEIIFRWLCQMRVAPYSYDWIDNFGHQSPRYLIPGLENLETGQRVMSIFKLVEFEPGRHLTIVLTRPRAIVLFGEVAGSYLILPQGEQRCRLIAKLLVRYPKRGPWITMRWFLPWGDLLMMRKQLLTLKRLAEQQAQ